MPAKKRRTSPFGKTLGGEDAVYVIRNITINNISEIVPGGILRSSGKVNFGDNNRGWWLGVDPADSEPKLDLTYCASVFLRLDETGLAVGGDGSGLTNITGGNITATNLAVISANTGALTVDDALTMGTGGVITWAGGGAQIGEDYIDFTLQGTDTQVMRWLSGSDVLGALSASAQATQTQVSLYAAGPASTKEGILTLGAQEHPLGGDEAAFVLSSKEGITAQASSYDANRIFYVYLMDAKFRNKVTITHTNALHIDPTSDADSDCLVVDVTGTPTLSWDESEDRFKLSKGLIFAFSTEAVDLVDAGSVGATEQDWIEVKVGGNTGYIRVYAAK